MVSKFIRAAGTALILGAAVAFMAGPADAAIRSVVGKPLQQAQAAAASGNYKAASAAVAQAESAGGITAEERKVINQMKEYIAAKTGHFEANSKNGALGKFSADYNAGRYNDVIADGEILRKYDALDERAQTIIAQAYYMKHDYNGCLRYIGGAFGNGGGEGVLQMKMRCAYETGDSASERGALETLVARTGKAEYWGRLLQSSQQSKGLTDHQSLDIYRIKYLTGSLRGGDDYTLLAQLAIEMNNPGEAQAVVEKAMKTNILSGDRTQRLLNMAKGQAGAAQTSLAKTAAMANAAPKGDALIKLSENYWGMGKYSDALSAAQAGIKKGVADKDEAQIRLGMAYLGTGQKDSAIRAFGAVSNADPNQKMVAQLWALYARR